MTGKYERIAAAESRQVERVTEDRATLTEQDLEDLVLLARERPTLDGWCDRRTVAELARRALYASTTAARIDEIAERTQDPTDRNRLGIYADGLRGQLLP